MSGFITIYNTDGKPVQPRLLSSLVESLRFRGPDKQKIWVDDNIGMGHALFKTTYEAEYENQPASIDNKVWITCSARIDDRENLINKMGMKKEINLNKTPDSELILHAYKKWGEACLDHLLGDFAFVIWDKEKQKLFCARDHFGMKKLYFSNKNKNIIISNTISTILKHPNINKEFNEKAIGGFLLFGKYTWMDKSLTMFNDVSTLLPAHKLVIKNGHINIERYWDIPDNIPLLHYKNKQEYIDHFLEVFTTAVSDRIRTSSISISMSGGMDSTAIAAITKKIQNKHKVLNTKLNAITATHDYLMQSKEGYYANLVAKYLDIPIHNVAGDDYPFLQPSIKTTFPIEMGQPTLWKDIEKKLSKFSCVTLIGSAADELLTYSSTQLAFKESGVLSTINNTIKLQQLYNKKLPLGIGIRTKLKKWRSSNNGIPTTNYPYPSWISYDFEKKLDLKIVWNTTWSSLREEPSPYSRKTILQKSLANADWCTEDFLMEENFVLTEKRDPFLDIRMVEFVLALPSLPWLFNKHILRDSMKGLLPDEVRYRPKTPLGHLHHALAQKDENKWIEAWKPSITSVSYIKDSFSFSQSDIPSQHYLKSRAIILNQWLKENIH